MRYVVQHHSNGNGHYDLMIETDGSDTMPTWQIARADINLLLEGRPVNAERIQDHRKHYLDYEGSISGDRGSVKIFDSGDCTTHVTGGDNFECELSGKLLSGKIMISRIEGSLFTITYSSFGTFNR